MSLASNTSSLGRISQKQPNRLSAKQLFIGMLSLILLIISLTSAIIYSEQKESARSQYKQVIASQVSAIHEVLDHELNSILMDCLFLTKYPALLNYLEQPNEINRQQINDSWSSFSEQKQIYDQVRYIDELGKEVVRINNKNGSAKAVLSNKLQTKSERYYFKKTWPLNQNDIYLSPFDLNIEQGKIEQPYKPMIRIATPVFDHSGKRRGIIILNYLAKRLFEIIDTPQSQQRGQTLLVNKESFYLRGRQPIDEWGFMFGPQGALKTVAYDFPLAWQAIKQQPSGQVDNESGIFIYEHLEFPATNSKLKGSFQRHWTLIHFTSNDELSNYFSPILNKVCIAAVTIMLILIPLIWVLTNFICQKQRAQQHLRSNEHYLRLILSSTAEGVIGINQKGQTIFVNMAAQKMVQFNQDELIGKYINDWIYHSDEKSKSHLATECQIIRCLKSGEQHQVKIEAFCHKNGAHFPVECQVMPLIEEGEFQGAVITFRDITERLKTEQELQHKASFDSLTSIYNRLKFEELLEHAMLEANRYRRPLSLAMFDIDHFKLINDAHGHQAGDAVLREISALTKKTLRDVDSVARWGGEEFMILAPETTLDGIARVAEKIRDVIASNHFSGIEQVTISFGVAQFKYHESEDDLLKRIDDALYTAKQLGRNRVERSE